jgi:hypothetical protein
VTFRRKPKIEANEWSATMLVSTAFELRDAIDEYPSLANRVLAGDADAGERALDRAQRIAALGCAMVLRKDDIVAGTPEDISPFRAAPALLKLECALVGLTQYPPDERAQLDASELAGLLDQDDLRSWMLNVIDAADRADGS